MAQTKILDFGNAFLKSISSTDRQPLIIPSCIHRLTPSQLRNKLMLDERSPLIEFQADSSYFIGDIASSFGGVNNWSSNKIDNIVLGLCASCPESQIIDRLVVCVPDATLTIDEASLLGNHNYSFNRRPIGLTVNNVEVVDETLGIWLGARSLLAHPDETNIVITIGAGTVNLTFYSGTGQVLHRAVSDSLGMKSIANDIALAVKSAYNLPSTPKVASVMAAMATKRYILAGTSLSIENQFNDAVSRWRTSLKSFVNDSRTELDYWQFAIGGAGANYLPSSDAVIVVPNPQTFAIESLLASYED
jgi:hypothetical protein